MNYRTQQVAARKAIRRVLADCDRPVVSTKFTEHSAVLLHLVTEQRPDTPVVWVDTGYNTRATLEFTNELSDRLSLALHTYRPEQHAIIQPPALDDPAHAAFSREVKIEPFERALGELRADAWISSIRRYQSNHRRTLPTFELTSKGVLKALPLIDWTPDTIERYCAEHDLPKGPACFDPTKGAPFRECGLHVSAAG